ncbi:MAG: hypothetical protein IJX04_06120, partial [Oscillospiraceae bacterium]|nr:hypothetical protein [Oscillospiraceae bacterium]
MKLLRNEVSFGYEVKFALHVRQHTSYALRTSYASAYFTCPPGQISLKKTPMQSIGVFFMG